MSEFDVTEVRTYHLEHVCNQPGCTRVLRLQMTTAQPQTAQAARSLPPPNVNGWVGGYCPEHAPGASA